MEGNITGISVFQIGHVSQDVVWVSTWSGNKDKYRTYSCAYREKGDSKLGMMQVEFTVSSSRCFIWLMILWNSCWKDEGPRGRWFPLVTSTWLQNQWPSVQNQFTKKIPHQLGWDFSCKKTSQRKCFLEWCQCRYAFSKIWKRRTVV